VSIAIATLASLAAWRMAADAERRSAARVARLAEALDTQPLPPSNRLRVIGAALAVVLALSTITVVAVALQEQRTAQGQSSKGKGQTDEGGSRPLELVGLAHERVGRDLTIRGTIRNPPGGADVDALTAMVFLYRTDGSLLASTQAPVTSARLTPGADATFATTVPADNVARYRVSFRSGDRVLPHVDRRTQS